MRNQELRPLENKGLDLVLGHLAACSPAASYVRTLTTDLARRGMMAAIVQAAALISPTAIPSSHGRGRTSNLLSRFESACALPWGSLKTERLGEVRAGLVQKGFAPATTNKVLAAIRGTLHASWLSGQMSAEDLARAKECLKSVRGERVSRGVHLTKAQLSNIFASAAERNDAVGRRDAAVIALLAVGLRRSEVANLRFEDFDQATGRLVVRGKNNKERSIYLNNGSLDAVKDWIEVRSHEAGSLVCAVGKGNFVKHERLSQQAVYKIFATHAKAAGVQATPHDLRRTMAGDAIDAGVDVFTLQALMGHSSPAVTQKYDRRGERAKEKAMALIHVPYKKRGKPEGG